MRVILDECLPRKLGALLTGHDVTTVPLTGWAGKKNGELLTLIAGASYDAFVTIDSKLSRQHDLSTIPVRFIVLQARSNRLADIAPLVPEILNALARTSPGDVSVVASP